MDNRRTQPIGIELVKRGIVGEGDINKALEYQKEHPSKKNWRYIIWITYR